MCMDYAQTFVGVTGEIVAQKEARLNLSFDDTDEAWNNNVCKSSESDSSSSGG
jgi:hypothetical protein